MEWKNIYRGILMGISDIVPGVSGGTIAVLLGIYDRLILAINGFFSREWKRHFKFLFPLGIGVVLAIFSLSHLMKWLLEHHERMTYFFFLGLIIGILPYLFRESDAKRTFKWHHIVLLLIGAILLILLPVNGDEGTVIKDKTILTYLWLFFCGFIASAAMILPGISGSFVLVVLGAYQTVIHAVSQLDIKVILVVGIGIVIGIITMSKIISFFLQKYRIATFAVIIGLVSGSVFKIFPGWPVDLNQLLLSILTFASGLLAAYILGKVEYEA